MHIHLRLHDLRLHDLRLHDLRLNDLRVHHLHIHHWVVWWFYVGLVCGVVAMVNIFTRDLSRSQDHLILLVGIIFWVLGGVVSWAAKGIEPYETPPVERPGEPAKRR